MRGLELRQDWWSAAMSEARQFSGLDQKGIPAVSASFAGSSTVLPTVSKSVSTPVPQSFDTSSRGVGAALPQASRASQTVIARGSAGLQAGMPQSSRGVEHGLPRASDDSGALPRPVPHDERAAVAGRVGSKVSAEDLMDWEENQHANGNGIMLWIYVAISLLLFAGAGVGVWYFFAAR